MTPAAPRDYRSSPAYLRSNRPELDERGRETGRAVWPLGFLRERGR